MIMPLLIEPLLFKTICQNPVSVLPHPPYLLISPHPTTFKWFSRFKNGMESLKDENRAGRSILHKNPEKVIQISNLIKENPRIGLWDIEEETGISKSLVESIIEEDLQLKKTPSKFIPKMLTIQQKENRVEVAKKRLKLWKKTLIGRKK
ncbi:hypothetical protein LAZ67_21001992 [Cordylochernes scorpioides]|uniref:Uncharacterized protein n=1 Tax=Cordylochernes scorpioides TaxID=51811 RepID=A0ABY6LQ32_9ARAC|nr:hypothetical protein LAZ67_21001992 [Cordylochernes scorpioides]